MDLVQKGQEANAGVIKAMVVKMMWTLAADFDIAAVVEMKDGSDAVMAYYGNIDSQSLNAFPFIKLSKDAGVGDTGGDNEEQLIIQQVDEKVSKIHIVCWDYGQVTAGKPARFADSDLKLSIVDDSGESHQVKLDAGEMGNTVVLMTIDNTSPIGAKLINTSKAGTLKAIKNSQQFVDIANS